MLLKRYDIYKREEWVLEAVIAVGASEVKIEAELVGVHIRPAIKAG